MKPRTHYQHIVDARVLLLDPAISFQRTIQILVVVPTADSHYRSPNVFEIGEDVSLFPKLIVVRMKQQLVPKLRAKTGFLPVQISRLTEATHLEKILVAVFGAPR